MLSNKLVCLKLMFCLGVNKYAMRDYSTNLYNMFLEEGTSSTACILRAFRIAHYTLLRDPTMYTLYKTHVYFDVLDRDTPSKDFGAEVKGIVEDLKARGYLYEEVLDEIARQHNELLRAVHTSLGIALPLSVFCDILAIPDTSRYSMSKARFYITHRDNVYSYHIFKYPELVLAQRSMFKNKDSLLCRLNMAMGAGIEECKDESPLGKYIKDQENEKFLCLRDLDRYESIILDVNNMHTLTRDAVKETYKYRVIEACDIRQAFEIAEEDKCTPATHIILTRDRAETPVSLYKRYHNKVSVAFVPNSASHLYNACMEGELKNTFVFSKKV